MSNLDDMLSAALSQLESDGEDSFSWKGSVYECVNSGIESREDYDGGGRRPYSSGTIEATRSQFTSGLPKWRDTIYIDSNPYSIREINTDSTTVRIRYGTVTQ